jgi:acetoin:2,6-dichlorophenolindophenol oxidoreductase subunit alpha
METREPGDDPDIGGRAPGPGSEGLALYRWMATSRALDRALATLSPTWFPVEGEEAVVVGAFFDLRPTDVAAPHYRDPFVAYLMRGAEAWRLAAQLLGRPAGYSKGRSLPFTGPVALNIVPWVAGDLGSSLGVATGAALALQDAGTDGVCVCTFGDGTANRGDFHENVNLAAAWKLPIVYVCQNNGWAISQREPAYLPGRVVDRAIGYGIPGVLADGQDVEEVRSSVLEATARARAGGGPTLIEARTSRVRGHWAGDTAAYRTLDERQAPLRDPLALFGERLIASGSAAADDLARIDAQAHADAEDAVSTARSSPEITADNIGAEDVYA